MERGVLTLAAASRHYADLAIALASSIRLREPNLPLAVATDLPAEWFEGFFDVVVPWNFSTKRILESKLDLYEMSPFEKTLFIDPDCLAMRSLAPVWQYFDGDEFGVYGRMETHARWFRTAPKKFRQILPTESYPIFNGGLFFWRRNENGKRVFQTAQRWASRFDELGLNSIYPNFNDEAAICLAMVALGIVAHGEEPVHVMFGPEPKSRKVHVDVLRGEARFQRRGRMVDPIIVHITHHMTGSWWYQRERARLMAAYPDSVLKPLDEIRVQAQAFSKWIRSA